jgi:hypothetical protein
MMVTPDDWWKIEHCAGCGHEIGPSSARVTAWGEWEAGTSPAGPMLAFHDFDCVQQFRDRGSAAPRIEAPPTGSATD